MPPIEVDDGRVNDVPVLDELEARDEFVARHVGPTARDIESMLRSVGAASLDALIDQVVPGTIRRPRPLRLPSAQTEAAAL